MNNSFEKLKNIVRELVSEDGCPWDKIQTDHSLKEYMFEEMHELFDAIDQKDKEGIKEELGDLLFHIIFQAEIARKEKSFQIEDIIETVSDKLIRRHPHIFKEKKNLSINELAVQWEKIKTEEKIAKGKIIKEKSSAIDGIPNSYSNLMKAYKIAVKANKIGFDAKNFELSFEKVKEELNELESAAISGKIENIEEEFGDLLFSLVNSIKFFKINPELALEKALKKFTKRFQLMEHYIEEDRLDITCLPIETLDLYWNKVKENERYNKN